VNASGGINDEVSAALSHKLNSFKVVLLDELSEVLADDFFVDVILVLRNVWDFKHEGCGHVNAIKDVKIDLQVRWNLSLLFFDFLIEGLFLLSTVV